MSCIYMGVDREGKVQTCMQTYRFPRYARLVDLSFSDYAQQARRSGKSSYGANLAVAATAALEAGPFASGEWVLEQSIRNPDELRGLEVHFVDGEYRVLDPSQMGSYVPRRSLR